MNTSNISARRLSGHLKQLILPGKQKHVIGDEEELPEPLSPAARLFHQPQFNCYIISILGFSTKIDVEHAKAGLGPTLLRHPRFSSIQVSEDGQVGQWIRTNVVLDDHIVIPDVDLTIANPDVFVEDYVTGLTRTTLDLTKPLWDIHILNIRTSDVDSVAIVRMHHSLGDGDSLISLLIACTRKTADPNSLPSVPASRKLDSGNRIGILVSLFVRIITLFCLVRNTVVDFLLFMASFVVLRDTKTPIKGGPGVEFHPKRVVHRTLSLDHFKLVKGAMNTTVNDVMLGVTAAGLSQYLERRYGGTDGACNSKLRLPDSIQLRATLLVNMRPSQGVHAIAARMMDEKKNTRAGFGNCIGYILLPFPIVIRDDPLDYVHTAKRIADRKKLSYEAFFTFSSSSLLSKIFGVKIAAALMHRILSNTTMSFSSLIGPSEEISLAGHPIAYIAPTVYGHAQALTIHFQSYMNKVKMVVAVDEQYIPDPHQLCDDLANALNLIKDAVNDGRKV